MYSSIHAGLKALNCNEQVRLSLKNINPPIPLTSSFRETTLKSEELSKIFCGYLLASALKLNRKHLERCVKWAGKIYKLGLYC